MRSYTEAENGAVVLLTPGDAFEIRLAENPTTGYRWHLVDWDHSILEMTRGEFSPSSTTQYGAGGEHVWEFVARGSGHVALRLDQRRSWEAATPAKSFTLDVSVA